MDKFKSLFGIEANQVKKNCVLLPVLPRGILSFFKIRSLARGKLFAAGSNQEFSLIQTGMGAGFVGDAVLYLKDTPCQNMILFGSCGLVETAGDLDIGSLVSPQSCYSYESFSQLLLEPDKPAQAFYPHRELFESLISQHACGKIKKASCATLTSLKLEEEILDILKRQKVEVVDMEGSAFFAAAQYSKLPAAALFYVTDVIREKPFYFPLDMRSKLKIFSAIKEAAGLISTFFRTNSGGIF